MADATGAKAIGLAHSDRIAERPHARVFAVRGTNGDTYTVVIGAYPVDASRVGARDVCTCPAGARGGRCYHAQAAHLLMAAERQPVVA